MENFKPFSITIKNHYYPIYSYQLNVNDKNMNVRDLKMLISKNHKGQPSINTQLLVYGGKILKNNELLASLISKRNNNSLNIHLAFKDGSKYAENIGLIPKKNNSKNTQNKNNSNKIEFINNPPPIAPPPHLYTRSYSMPNLYQPNFNSLPFAPPSLINQSSNNVLQRNMNQFNRSYSNLNNYYSYSNIPQSNYVQSKTNENNLRNRANNVPSNVARNDTTSNNVNRNNVNRNNVDRNNVAANNVARNDENGNNVGYIRQIMELFNVNVLLRLGIFMWLFGSHLNNQRWNMLCVLAVIYYLYVFCIVFFL